MEQSATAVHLLSGREVVDSALAAPWPIRADSPLPDLARLTHALAHCDPVFLDSRSMVVLCSRMFSEMRVMSRRACEGRWRSSALACLST